MTMGQRIRERRLALDISQADLARAAGIQSNHMCRLEKGESTNPGLDVITKIADKLGVTLDWLAHGKEPEQAEGDSKSSTAPGAAA